MNGRQLNPSAVGPSRTTTLTAAPPSASQDDSEEAGVLRLRPSRPAGEPSARRVVWSEGTVDNEGLGRKKSKICCIYHKPKAFDESSDESSSSSSSPSDSSSSDSSDSDCDSDSIANPDSESQDQDSGPDADGPNLSKGIKQKLAQQNKQCKPHHHYHHHHHDQSAGTCNAHRESNKKKKKKKERGSTTCERSQTRTVTITQQDLGQEEVIWQSDAADDSRVKSDGLGFRPNAYERGSRSS